MATLKAVVRGGRAVLIDDRIDLPEGTELELDVLQPLDQLDQQELAALDAALEAGQREYEASGKAFTREEVLARLRAAR